MGVEKVDQLINLVGELVITQAMIEQRISALDPVQHESLINSVGQLTRNTRDLQESVSYTHLDVYKRQEIDEAVAKE